MPEEAKKTVRLGTVPTRAAKKAPARNTAARKAAAKKAAVKKALAAEEAAVAAAKQIPPDLTDEELDRAVEAVFDGVVLEPVYEAFMMKVAGATYEQIVQKTSFETVNAARVAVERYTIAALAERTTERRAEAMSIAEHTYQQMKYAFFDKAFLGQDANAAMVVIRAQNSLDKIQRNGEVDSDAAGGKNIVIAGTPEEYAAQLRKLYNEQHQIEPPDGIVDAEVVPDA